MRHPQPMADCLYEETVVMLADGQERKIRDIRVGDSVFNPKKNSPSVVQNIYRGVDALLEMAFEANTLLVTKDHPICTPSGVVRAGTLKEGARVLYWRDPEARVLSVKEKPSATVYNLELDEDGLEECFLANHIWVGGFSLQNTL